MRHKIIDLIISLAQKDENVFLISNDAGYGVIDPFIERYPDRYLNVGISEQNMIGVAVGLAKVGKRVFIYTLANFGVLRCLEQIRNDICYQDANITLIALCCGIYYETQGFTHFGIEDIGCIRSFPNTSIYNPANNHELEFCFNESLSRKGFNYFRLEQGIPVRDYTPTKINNYVLEVYSKDKINIISTGVILEEVLQALKELKNLHVGVFSVPFLTHPISDAIRSIIQDSLYTIVIEEHISNGGLFSIISEVASQLTQHSKIIPIGLSHNGISKIGTHDFMRKNNKMSAKNILNTLKELASCTI